jgi:hypothetical protein
MTGPDTSGPRTTPRSAQEPRPIRLDIARVTLHDYSPGRRGEFAAALAARLAGHGAPEEAARQAAAEILAAVDAELGHGHA